MQYHNFVDVEKDEDEDEAEAKGADSSGDICDEDVQYHKFVDEEEQEEDGMEMQDDRFDADAHPLKPKLH